MTMTGLLFCPCEPTERLVIIVVVVFVIGIAAAAAFVVASTIGSNFSVVIWVEFNKMLAIVAWIAVSVCSVLYMRWWADAALAFLLFHSPIYIPRYELRYYYYSPTSASVYGSMFWSFIIVCTYTNIANVLPVIFLSFLRVMTFGICEVCAFTFRPLFGFDFEVVVVPCCWRRCRFPFGHVTICRRFYYGSLLNNIQ